MQDKCKVCPNPGTKKCSHCDTKYCSRDCQVKDWKVHKPLCQVYRHCDLLSKAFESDKMYNDVLKEHALNTTDGFPTKSRRLVQFNFSSVDGLKDMALKTRADPGLQVMLVRPNEMIDEDPDTQWAIAMDFSRGYDIEKEAAVAFRVPVDGGYYVQPFIINLQ